MQQHFHRTPKSDFFSLSLLVVRPLFELIFLSLFLQAVPCLKSFSLTTYGLSCVWIDLTLHLQAVPYLSFISLTVCGLPYVWISSTTLLMVCPMFESVPASLCLQAVPFLNRPLSLCACRVSHVWIPSPSVLTESCVCWIWHVLSQSSPALTWRQNWQQWTLTEFVLLTLRQNWHQWTRTEFALLTWRQNWHQWTLTEFVLLTWTGKSEHWICTIDLKAKLATVNAHWMYMPSDFPHWPVNWQLLSVHNLSSCPLNRKLP